MSLLSSSEDDDDERNKYNKYSMNGANEHDSCTSGTGNYMSSEDCTDTAMSCGHGCHTDVPSRSALTAETDGLDIRSHSCKSQLGDFLPCTSCQSGSNSGLPNIFSKSELLHGSHEENNPNNPVQSDFNCSGDNGDKCTESSQLSEPCACLLDPVDHPLKTNNFHAAGLDMSESVHLPDGYLACIVTDSTVALPAVDDVQHTESRRSSKTISSVLSGVRSSFASSFFLLSLSRREKLVLLCLAIVDLTSQMCLSIMAPFFPAEVCIFCMQCC